jgi:hypothetical protein
MPQPELDVARSRTDVARLDGKRATAAGTYLPIERPVKGVVTTPGPRDHAVLVLEDGSRLYLEPLDSPKSAREPDELRRFDGRRVRVKGVLHKVMPSEGQSLIAPCIAAIEEIAEEPVRP